MLDLASLPPERGGDGRAGFVLASATSGQPGESVAAALAADGDGFEDLVAALNPHEKPPPYRTGDFAYVVRDREAAPFAIGFDGLP